MFRRKNKPHSTPKTGEKPYRDLYDWMMFGVGVAGIVGIVMTLWIGQQDQIQNGRDTAVALNEMAEIANTMAAERKPIEQQAAAASDSANAAKTTAQLAKGQTDATVRQADALIRSAQTTVVAANAQLAAAEAIKNAAAPSAHLEMATITGFASEPDKNGLVTLNIRWNFLNTGGVAIYPGREHFHIFLTDKIPPIRPTGNIAYESGGEDFPTPPQMPWGPTQDAKFSFPSAAVRDVKAQKSFPVIWGDASYSEKDGKPHHFCYADIVLLNESFEVRGLVAIPNPSYGCPTT